MRFNPAPLMAIFLLVAIAGHGQDPYSISLKSGSFIPEKNINESKIKELNLQSRPGGKRFLIIQFEKLPDEQEKVRLRQSGIDLLDYVPNNAYSVVVSGSIDQEVLISTKARSVIRLSPEQKMQPALARGVYPQWAIKLAGTLDVWISFPRTINFEEIRRELDNGGFAILSSAYKDFQILELRIPTSRIRELAALPFIEYVQARPKDDEPVNDRSSAYSRANILNSSLAGERNLDGEGVVIGVGDDADPTRHIDFNGRLINRAANAGGTHGLHVMGTVGGAGIRQELYRGIAPRATLLAQRFSGILSNAPVYVQDHGMVITNNSYGNVTECDEMGTYDLLSRALDRQAFQMPSLQHVFAAGNSGDSSCAPYLSGFSNILAGYQTAKNIISVGGTDALGVRTANSSRGPVRDGRIKPELVALGQSVMSTVPVNNYGSSNGTSMAAPAVSGGLALLYQRYRQLHGVNPENALMKALLCNGATDLGNAGPDFSYGFGQLNLLRSVKMLEQNNYISGTVNSGVTNVHSITVGSSIAALKVMLYWNDSAAAPFASSALVNDLDLTVTDASMVTHFPQLLNTTPSGVNNVATTGPDHINNIEQVIITNPVPGTYNISVAGTAIPFNGQHAYYIVFDTIAVSTILQFPFGGEKFQPGEMINIEWDSFGSIPGDFTIEFSSDNGNNWTVITNGANVAGDLRRLAWTVPAVSTAEARMRITHNGTGMQSTSEPFTILGIPAVVLAALADQCEGYININWPAVTGATDYEVFLYRGAGDIRPIGITTDTKYIIGGLSRDTSYFVSVRARINGSPGRRSLSLTRNPTNGSCSGTISDKDFKLDAILSPVRSGRRFTSTELTANELVTIRIENLDNAPSTGDIVVSYSLNSGAPVTEILTNPNILSRQSYVHTFVTPIDMSAPGVYELKVVVSYPGDPYTQNDTLTKVFKQLDNPFIDLSADFIDDIETAAVQSHTTAQIGLEGLDRYDFSASNSVGQIRTFINTGVAFSGTKALTLDADRYISAGNTDTLFATFNLQGYNTATDNIRLDFMYKHHGQLSHPANKIWIRGSDQDPWIEAYDLFANQADEGVFRRSASIELNNLLSAAGQTFSSSMQVRWMQWGQIIAADNETGAGYTFDDIRLYKVSDDVQMISIDEPISASCGLNNAVPIQVTVRNSVGNVLNNIPVFFQADGGAIVSEIIPVINGNSSIQYQFTATADLSAIGNHTLKVWVDLASDSFHDNDTLEINLFNAPLITSFPYLEDFELDDGSWHASGKRSSWEYGTPASPKINRAASGTKAWKTRLGGHYNNLEKSFLISPCFDVTAMTHPMLSFSVALDIEDCGASLCDAAYVEYSADGETWTRLGAEGQGTNWYNHTYTGAGVWSVQDYTRWHVATIPLPSGLDRLRIRFVMETDPAVTREGIAIDDIHVYDSLFGIYTGVPSTSNVVTQAALSGNNWVDFIDDNGIIASVNPSGQTLGNTDVQAFIHTGPVRTNTGQYYHNRNITIKPANTTLADSAVVRFYFLDSETEALINANGCTACSKPRSAYELGVTKYSNNNDALENGTLADNVGGDWIFRLPADVRKVPFDKGYYAEFRVKDFSEFWLNNGGLTNDQPLPLELIEFTAVKGQSDIVHLKWSTASEENTDRFEIELARGNEAWRRNEYLKIGEVKAGGQSSALMQYQFNDEESFKSGVRYYRLKMVDQDGQFHYSPERSLIFNDEIKWQVFPNPSTGLFNLVYQAEAGERVVIRVYDVNGRVVFEKAERATAFIQKSGLDLSPGSFGSGMYLIEIQAGKKKQAFRVIKQ